MNTSTTYTLKYDSQIHCVSLEWLAPSQPETLREGFEQLLSSLKEKNTGSIVVYTKNLKLAAADKKWISETWLPQAIQAGGKACAFITTADYLDRLSVENAITAIDNIQMEVEYFDNVSEAGQWLKNPVAPGLNTEVSKIYYNPIVPCVVMEWQGYATSKEFRAGTKRMGSILVEKKASKVIADVSRMKLIGAEDQQWVQEYFLPKALKAGFKTLALVTSKDHFNRVSIENITQKIDPDILTIKFFDDIFSAEDWLKNF